MNKKVFFNLILVAVSIYFAVNLALGASNLKLIGCEYVLGFLSSVFCMNIWLNYKNKKINSYKNALEKESLTSAASSSKVKVLEEKIKVLETALNSALNK